MMNDFNTNRLAFKNKKAQKMLNEYSAIISGARRISWFVAKKYKILL